MMKKTGKAIAGFGVRRFLSIIGSMSALAGATCAAYGPAPAYGINTCTQDTECTSQGSGWYCDKSSGTGYCAHAEPDAGTTQDAGK
ncbi:MAG TPA: hypothetical protein VGK67_17720 [Myxococcales bacterium]|jgi:hypothetical protein